MTVIGLSMRGTAHSDNWYVSAGAYPFPVGTSIGASVVTSLCNWSHANPNLNLNFSVMLGVLRWLCGALFHSHLCCGCCSLGHDK